MAEKEGNILGSWALPNPTCALLASPGAVRVFADEQRLSGTADGAVGLVPVVVVQEETVQELVLGEGQT